MKSANAQAHGGKRANGRSAASFLPEHESLRSLREASRTCRGCDLYKRATQTVFGAGDGTAELMLIGEVPGDQDDLQGKPFVGPAGRLLDEALEAAGVTRQEVYMTNAVKHFKWEPRGKRRLHSKPSSGEIAACKPWLEAELRAVHPRTIVCLGATAAQSLLGRTFRLTHHLGEVLFCSWADRLIATYHPSAILRAPDPDQRQRMKQQFVRHLKVALAS